MTTETKKVLFMDGVVQSIEAGDNFVRLKFLKDGNKFPDTITFWEKFKDKVLVGKGQRARVRFTLSDKLTSQGNPYKDGVSAQVLGPMTTEERGAPTEEEDAPIFPSETHQETQKAPSTPKAEAKPAPLEKPVPAAPRNGWTESYSQGREAHESSRRSIEAQVALKAAVDLLRDMLTTVEMPLEAKVGLVEKHLAHLTMLAASAIREARGG